MRDGHYTYVDCNRDSLRQGDVLSRTPEIEAIFGEVHPHYLSPEYTHFQVITQSCDLVKRGSQCKSRYITLAAVRTLESVITRELQGYGDNSIVEIEGVWHCTEAIKRDLEGFLAKIYNNNAKDFFFLQAEPGSGLENDSCTFLALSIALKADLHYEACLGAKILQLEDNFQSKLGWMVGNLYSRVGTKDYVPYAAADKTEFSSIVEAKFSEHLRWVNSKDFKLFKEKIKVEPASTLTAIEIHVSGKRAAKLNSGVAELISVMKKAVPDITADQEEVLKNKLSMNPMVKSKFQQ